MTDATVNRGFTDAVVTAPVDRNEGGSGRFRPVLNEPNSQVRLTQRLREALIAFTVLAVLSTALAIILKFTSEAA